MVKRFALSLFLLLLTASSGWAATYYVDSGTSCTNCDGTAHTYTSGTTGPFKTITQVNDKSFTAGDDVYFKMGGTWSGTQLTVDWSGVSTSNPSVIGAYCGSGTIYDGTNCTGQELPVLDGAPSGTGNSKFGTTPTKGSWGGLITASGVSNVTVQYLTVSWSGGVGIRFKDGTNNKVIGCNIYHPYRNGIQFETSHFGIVTHNYLSGCSRQSLETTSDKTPTIMFNGLNSAPGGSNDAYIAYNILEYGRGEGINIAKGSSGALIEYNRVTNHENVAYYIGTSRNCVVRYNIANEYADPRWPEDTRTYVNRLNACYAINDEAGRDYVYSQGNKIYRNACYLAPRGFGLYTDKNDVEGVSTFKDNEIYNNVCVDCEIGIQTFNDTGPYENSFVKNNIFFCTGSNTCEMANVPSSHDGLTFDYNLWHKTPDADAQGANDQSGAAVLSKTTWSDITAANPPTLANFAITGSDTKAKDLGATLNAAYAVDPFGVTAPSGSAWDIGLSEYNQGNPPESPEDPAGIVFWDDLESGSAPYYGGGANTWSANANAEFASGGNKVGTNGLYCPNGTNNYATFTFSGVTPLPLSAGSVGGPWFRFATASPPLTTQFINFTTTDFANSIRILYMSGGNLRLRIIEGGRTHDITTTGGKISLGSWYYPVIRYDAANDKGRIELYDSTGTLVDSAQSTSLTNFTALSAHPDYVRLGFSGASNAVTSFDSVFSIADSYAAELESFMNFVNPPLELSCGNDDLEDWESCATCKEDDADCVDDETAVPAVVITSPANGGTFPEVTGLYLSVTQAANCRFGTGDDNEYSEMDAGDVLTRSGLTHTKTLTLEDGEYTYHVACLNAYGEGRASTTFTQDTPAAITACIDYGVNKFSINPGDAVAFQYCNTVPEGAEGLSCEWTATNAAEEEVWTLTDAGCNDTSIGFTPEDDGLHTVALTVSTTSPEDSDTVTETNLFRVWKTANVKELSSTGDWTASNQIDFLRSEDILTIGDVNVDLSALTTVIDIGFAGTTSGTRTFTGGGQNVTQWPTWGGPVVLGGSWGSLPALINKKGEWPE